ncbi:MAG: hypothetical protein JW795_17740 [Chitinivibrionales bacterium]|nr:hypothetical protein [Chitinivibrionales bacterium]
MKTSSIEQKAFYSLCFFAVCNPILAQIGFLFMPSGIAGLSLMQLFQGCFFVVVIGFLFLLRSGHCPLLTKLWILLGLFATAWTINQIKTMLSVYHDATFMRIEMIHYFKILVSIMLWIFAVKTITDQRQSHLLLSCIIAGSLVTAAAIFYFYFSAKGLIAGYAYAGVRASTGAEGVSGKGTAGFLLTALFILLAIKNIPLAIRLPAILSIGSATFLIFDRSSQIAFCCSMLWSIIWALRTKNSHTQKRVFSVLAALVLCFLLYIAFNGTQQLSARWTRDLSHGLIGSGRNLFYSAATQWIVLQSGVWDLLFGIGFGNILPLMHEACGLYIHTHSDFFDTITMWGVLGLLFYLYLFFTAYTTFSKQDHKSIQYLASSCIILSFLIMSLITGQFESTQSMFCFMTASHCLSFNQKNQVLNRLSRNAADYL